MEKTNGILKNLKVALVVDWLFDYGGAEEVLFDLLEIFPNAEIFTSAYFPQGFAQKVFEEKFQKRIIHTSFLQKIPFFNRRPKLASVLRTIAFESFNFEGFDLIISSASAESKGILPGDGIPHICYCHTPTRYFWNDYHAYKNRMEFGILNPIAKFFFPLLAKKIRIWDYIAAQRVDHFITNSATSQKRISRYYKRKSTIIHPGISEEYWPEVFEDFKARKYYFACSRVVPYKRLDLLVEVFNKNGLPLIIASSTQNESAKQLQKISKENISWEFGVSQERKFALYRNARAFLFPGQEDFGITPCEAIGCGTPVIAFKKGGATETVREELTGIFFEEQTESSLESALSKFEQTHFYMENFYEERKRFGRKQFQQNLCNEIEDFLKKFRENS